MVWRMRTHIILLLAAAFLAVAVPDAGAGQADEFPGSWESKDRPDVQKLLFRHRAIGCSERFWRKHRSKDEVLVYCRDRDKLGRIYIVLPREGNVHGPSDPDKDLPPP